VFCEASTLWTKQFMCFPISRYPQAIFWLQFTTLTALRFPPSSSRKPQFTVLTKFLKNEMDFAVARENQVARLQIPNEELRTLLYRIPRLTPKLF
jgi:hypothetical protein